MRVKIDEATWAAKGVTMERVVERESLKFTFPDRPDTVSVIINGGEMELYPERSSDHVALIAKLGLDHTSATGR